MGMRPSTVGYPSKEPFVCELKGAALGYAGYDPKIDSVIVGHQGVDINLEYISTYSTLR